MFLHEMVLQSFLSLKMLLERLYFLSWKFFCLSVISNSAALVCCRDFDEKEEKKKLFSKGILALQSSLHLGGLSHYPPLLLQNSGSKRKWTVNKSFSSFPLRETHLVTWDELKKSFFKPHPVAYFFLQPRRRRRLGVISKNWAPPPLLTPPR